MPTLQVTQVADAGGTLHVVVPGQQPNQTYRVVMSVEPAEAIEPLGPRDGRGWPEGFFDRLAGSWEGEFAQQFEGNFEQPDEF